MAGSLGRNKSGGRLLCSISFNLFDMKKEIILRSKDFSGLILQIFDENEFGMLGEDNADTGNFFTDNENYAYAVLRLLKEAEKRGCFNKMKDEQNKEEILI